MLQIQGICVLMMASRFNLEMKQGLTPWERKPQDIGSPRKATTLCYSEQETGVRLNLCHSIGLIGTTLPTES